jgi:hypothetical protein
MDTKRMCRCCEANETFGRDGLCVECRLLGCQFWEFSTGRREPVNA